MTETLLNFLGFFFKFIIFFFFGGFNGTAAFFVGVLQNRTEPSHAALLNGTAAFYLLLYFTMNWAEFGPGPA